MKLSYTKHETLSLKSHPEFDERWLQNQIVEDPGILGLGDIVLVERERSQGKAGRLDLLFSDLDQNRRYEVELMLGATDPSHVVRTIEYWDIERRRYPAYEHVAVLVAEDITSRFLHVLSLFSGSIPLIAIQLNALKVGDQIVLDFVKVLDQTELRTDDEEEGEKTPADRAYWTSRRPPEIIAIVDAIHKLINEIAQKPQSLNYNRGFIGLTDGGRSRNFVVFWPRKQHLRFGLEISEKDEWVNRLEEAGLEFAKKPKRIVVNLAKGDLEANESLIRELVGQAVQEYEA